MVAHKLPVILVPENPRPFLVSSDIIYMIPYIHTDNILTQKIKIVSLKIVVLL